MLRAVLSAALFLGASSLCQNVKNKLKEFHINVQNEIERLLPSPPSNSTPQQLHLSTTGTPGELFITWVVPDSGDVCTDSYASIGGATFPAAWSTYEAGVAGWAGHIYTARLTGLAPGAAVSYSVHSCGSTTGPISITGPKANGPEAETLVAVMADMGTVIPLGFATAAQIEKDHSLEPFDLFVLAGDISKLYNPLYCPLYLLGLRSLTHSNHNTPSVLAHSVTGYATVDPPKNELEEVWDAYGRLVEPFMSLAPFNPGVGNHEHTPGTLKNASGTFKVDYAAYQTRYGAVPPTGNANLWYSYDHGAVHFTCINSEEAQTPGSPQAAWLAADLAAAAANRAAIPWLVMMQHRPVYSSTKSEAGDHTPGSGFPLTLEPYIKQYGVDLFLTGHEHQYERTLPVFNGTVFSTGGGNATFISPGAPIYVVQGTSGAFVSGDWEEPQPSWSAFREGVSYGYGKMRVQGGSRLTYQWISIEGKVLDAFTILK